MLAAVALGREDLVRKLAPIPAARPSQDEPLRAPPHAAAPRRPEEPRRHGPPAARTRRRCPRQGQPRLHAAQLRRRDERPGDCRPADRGRRRSGGAERQSLRASRARPERRGPGARRSPTTSTGWASRSNGTAASRRPSPAIRRDQVQIFLSQEDPKRLAGSLSMFVQDVDALYATTGNPVPSSCGRRPTFPGACAAWIWRTSTAIACA